MTFERLLTIVALLFSLAGTATAQPGDDDDQGSRPICPAPVMVCSNDVGTPDGCPRGYDCACVPSCPVCRDCAARVCVASREPEPECRTACDCEPGLGCFDRQCIAGFAPVFCCESDQCPSGEQCQHREGRMDRCGAAEPECRSACDCESGQACHDGSCTVTDVPVYCCGNEGCPTGFPCDRRDGSRSQCEVPEDRCAKRLGFINKAIDKIVDRSRRCMRDEDCRWIETNTECGGSCGAFVNRRVAPLLGRAVRYLDHKVCSMYQDDGCPYAEPGCVAQEAACVEGLCTGRVPVNSAE